MALGLAWRSTLVLGVNYSNYSASLIVWAFIVLRCLFNCKYFNLENGRWNNSSAGCKKYSAAPC